MFRTIAFLIGFAIGLPAQAGGSFDGTWVYRAGDQNVMKFVIQTSSNSTTVVVTHPKQMSFSQDGVNTSSGSEYVTGKPESATVEAGALKFADGPVMTLKDADHAELTLAPQLRPLQLVRIPAGQTVEMASPRAWPTDIQQLRSKLTSLVKEDQDARNAFDEKRMAAADAQARPEIVRILERYGWVTDSLAGADAAHQFWLLVQHQDLPLQEHALTAMKKEADAGKVSKADFAYLFDRVQMGEGKPQHWGTQTRCTDGKPVLSPVDDPTGLDQRRAELGMMPEAEYLNNEYLIRACAQRH